MGGQKILYVFLFFGAMAIFQPVLLSQAIENTNDTVISNSRKIVKIWIPTRNELNKLANFVEPMEVHQDYVIADVTEKTLKQIIDMGFTVQILFESTEEFTNFYPKALPQAGAEGLYHSYSEIKAELQQLQLLYPQIAKVYDIGDSWEKTQGIADRDIWAIKISDNVYLDENEPESLFIGCHHAREWISVEVPFYLAQYLVENYDTDPLIRSYVDNGQIWIVPMLNPDGHQYSIDVDRWWRKNRRNNGGGNYGVDLNRNYSYMWGGPGSSGDPRSDIYRGPSPFSEPETQAIRNLALNHDFQAVMSYHSYGQLILYPWSHTSDPAPDRDHLSLLAEDMADLIYEVHGKTYTPQQGANLYLASGVTDDWFYGELGVFGFTNELRPKGYPYFILPESEIIPTWEENKPAALYLIQWTQQQGNPLPDIKANGSDGPLKISQGTVLTVTINLDPAGKNGIDSDWWVVGEPPFGRYWYTLNTGWVRSDAPIRAYAGALLNLSFFEVLNTTDLSTGSYTFNFGIDLLMNGILDYGDLYYDSVQVTIE